MQTITLEFPDKSPRSVPFGTRINEVLEDITQSDDEVPVVAVRMNNMVCSVTSRLEVSAKLEPIFLDTRDGSSVYRRSLCFLLSIAARRCFPERRLIIGHSFGDGYFYHFEGEKTSKEDLQKLREEMASLIEEKLPIQKRVLSYCEALDYFRENNQLDTALLIRQRNEMKVETYECADFIDLFFGPLVPNTSMLTVYELRSYEDGFLLRYPEVKRPSKIAPFSDIPILFSIYNEYKSWGKILGLHCVGKLNEMVQQDEMKHFIQVAEALHDKKIAEMADKIYARKDKVQVVLIAGPSASGKTTFLKKLTIQLKVIGLQPIPLSLDNYFLPREETPLDEDGNYDFESINAIDIPYLNDHLVRLMKNENVEIPRFDFKTGKRKSVGTTLKLPKTGILLIEGIHGLNDELTPLIPKEKKFKIYVSALTQLNLDDHNRVSTSNNRLIRRMVRDSQFRNRSARDNIRMWNSVRKGEEKNIFPFQDSADAAFNSALDYELAVLKGYTMPLLETVKPYHEEYSTAAHLMRFLENFTSIPAYLVPTYSILREFIGQSGFKY